VLLASSPGHIFVGRTHRINVTQRLTKRYKSTGKFSNYSPVEFIVFYFNPHTNLTTTLRHSFEIMFAKLVVFVVATMAVFVSAAPSGDIHNSCNAGAVQCCEFFC
jgi:hypothetical protein